MTKIAIQGIGGRMGRVLAELIAARQDCRVVAGVDTAACQAAVPVVADAFQLASLAEQPDVLIDFSHPDAAERALAYCAGAGLPCVICTTGLSGETQAALRRASQKAAVFCSANMSLGVSLLSRLVKQAAAALRGFDIEIVEKHHRGKLDAPSGTALMLAEAAGEGAGKELCTVYSRHDVRRPRAPDELGISAVRGGSIVGEHDVLFCGPDEVVTLSHAAYSRDVFAHGAVAAALFLRGKGPGLYSMDNLLAGVENQ